jgi:hypothetical protein
MKLSTAARIASATVVTAVATLSLAAPASAMLPDPQGGAITGSSTGGATVDDGTNWTGIAAGGAGGVAVVGAGVATVIVLRRHRHEPHAAA